MVRTIGFNTHLDFNLTVREDIIKSICGKYKACVVCGQTSGLVIDHKNDLYNDERVSNKETQTIDDFQRLCTHCNLQKRSVCIKTKKTGKRYGATNIPRLEHHNIDFIKGSESFDENDINAMVGTYWYDVIAFETSINFVSKLT